MKNNVCMWGGGGVISQNLNVTVKHAQDFKVHTFSTEPKKIFESESVLSLVGRGIFQGIFYTSKLI